MSANGSDLTKIPRSESTMVNDSQKKRVRTQQLLEEDVQ